jgi:hypothetical protein
MAPSIKILRLWRLPKIKGFIFKFGVLSLWPSYIGERRTTFAKAYGIKNEVLLGTLWEHVKNLGTLSFDPLLSPPPNPQEKREAFHSMKQLLISCMEILFLKSAATILAWTTLVPWPVQP